MQVSMVCLEDGITSCGFRRMASFVSRLNADTRPHYVSTNLLRSTRRFITGTLGTVGEVGDDQVDEIAHGLAGSDLVGFSSMTGYAPLTRRVIARLRELNPSAYLVWGGIHPIIHPEDAITADVDAICVGEGEFAFEEVFAGLQEGRDVRDVSNFWFKDRRDGSIVRNGFLPLMTPQEMDTLPFPQYGDPRETVYAPGKGFVPLTEMDYFRNFSFGYETVWSVGCPFHCTFCGNTRFIANDPKYKRVRHASARHIVDEVKAARRTFPFVNQVNFHDDSFMAIPYAELEEFADLWHDELDLPFMVYGVIPNYVKEEKFELLTWAGMQRIRMGIQSGSQRVLDFYKRPTPPARILEAGEVIAKFSPKYHLPPAYDIIVDNPIETRQDIIDTLELLYRMPRPYTLNIFSLKVIPNTELERLLAEQGIDIDGISSSYAFVPPRASNMLLYVLAVWRPPRWLFDRLLRFVKASAEPQRSYPRLGLALRTAYLTKRGLDRLRFFDLSVLPSRPAYLAWRAGLADYGRKHAKRPPRPVRGARRRVDVAPRIPVVEAEAV